MTWFNKDNLLLKFGTEKLVSTIAGEYKTYGPLRQVEVKVDMTKLTTTETIIADVTLIPKGSWLESVQIDVNVAAATGTSISMGLVKTTDRTTTLGAGGLLNAEVTANLTLGKVLLYDASTTNHGTLLGTATTDTALISAKIAGSTFTTGNLTVRINYRTP